jgi:hypothetical protein
VYRSKGYFCDSQGKKHIYQGVHSILDMRVHDRDWKVGRERFDDGDAHVRMIFIGRDLKAKQIIDNWSMHSNSAIVLTEIVNSVKPTAGISMFHMFFFLLSLYAVNPETFSYIMFEYNAWMPVLLAFYWIYKRNYQ